MKIKKKEGYELLEADGNVFGTEFSVKLSAREKVAEKASDLLNQFVLDISGLMVK